MILLEKILHVHIILPMTAAVAAACCMLHAGRRKPLRDQLQWNVQMQQRPLANFCSFFVYFCSVQLRHYSCAHPLHSLLRRLSTLHKSIENCTSRNCIAIIIINNKFAFRFFSGQKYEIHFNGTRCEAASETLSAG